MSVQVGQLVGRGTPGRDHRSVRSIHEGKNGPAPSRSSRKAASGRSRASAEREARAGARMLAQRSFPAVAAGLQLIPSSSSHGEKLSARASMTSVSRRGKRMPRSSRPISVRSSSHIAPSASCDKPAWSRRSRRLQTELLAYRPPCPTGSPKADKCLLTIVCKTDGVSRGDAARVHRRPCDRASSRILPVRRFLNQRPRCAVCSGLQRTPVLALVVRTIVARADRLPPPVVLAIPR